MEAELICYTQGKISDSERSSFKRDFLGYTDKSNKGKYTYKREGLLDKIPHLKPSKGVVIVKKSDSPKVKKLLRKYKSHIESFPITINKAVLE